MMTNSPGSCTTVWKGMPYSLSTLGLNMLVLCRRYSEHAVKP